VSFLSRLRAKMRRPYESAGPADAASLVEDGALLLDVRETVEFKAGHAPQARNVPLGQLTNRLDKLPEGRTIVTVCRSGSRSAYAASILSQQGYEVVNLSGEMNAWQRAGLPVVAASGRRGRVA
jgi:rhodanese-related sulfurtransferase